MAHQLMQHRTTLNLPTLVCGRIILHLHDDAVITRIPSSPTTEGHNQFGIYSGRPLLIEPGRTIVFHPGYVRWPSAVLLFVDGGETLPNVQMEPYFRMGDIEGKDKHQIEVRLRNRDQRKTIRIDTSKMLARFGFLPLHPVAGRVHLGRSGITRSIRGRLPEEPSSPWLETPEEFPDPEEFPAPEEITTVPRSRSPSPSPSNISSAPPHTVPPLVNPIVTSRVIERAREEIGSGRPRPGVVIERHYYYSHDPSTKPAKRPQEDLERGRVTSDKQENQMEQGEEPKPVPAPRRSRKGDLTSEIGPRKTSV